jgi:hypothetical protein
VTSARPFAIVALAVCACATTPLSAPKVVRAFPLPSYQIQEECFTLKEGDRVEFAYKSTEPVDFNIHYHEGQAVVMPISREKSREDAGFYTAQLAQGYCLMWEAGAPGAVIDYRILVRPPAS